MCRRLLGKGQQPIVNIICGNQASEKLFTSIFIYNNYIIIIIMSNIYLMNVHAAIDHMDLCKTRSDEPIAKGLGFSLQLHKFHMPHKKSLSI